MSEIPIHVVSWLKPNEFIIGYPPRLILEEWEDNPNMPKPIEITEVRHTKDSVTYEVRVRFREDKR